MAQQLIGNETFSDEIKKSQVYYATHDGEGNRLPHLINSFISFSFGGKFIEDFNLIVVNSGDRMSKNFYADFSDFTTENEAANGQLYWGTRLITNKIELTLATDSMTEKQLDSFREWFAPGEIRELILSEHPNRAIMARVSEPPQYSFIPFEQLDNIKIGDNPPIEVSTTVYKGEVTLNFIADEPNWYSKLNYMPSYIDKNTLERLEEDSSNVNKVTTLNNRDALKIMLEDGIPHQSLLMGELNGATFFLGGNYLVTERALVGVAKVGQTHLGIIVKNSSGLEVGPTEDAKQYLFYSGTAKSYPTIKFSMLPILDNEGYISHPINKIQNSNLDEYSYIQIGNNKFYFTTPSILTGYNQAITIFKRSSSVAEARSQIQEKVNEYYSRAWAMKCLSSIKNINSSLIEAMKEFIDTTQPIEFTFNSQTGESVGKFNVKVNNTYQIVEENVGDMVRSNYLIIEGRDYLNSNGAITLENCHKITSNESLTDVLVFYKNMYL